MVSKATARFGAIRIAFLTVPAFQKLDHQTQQEMKRRALRVLQRQARFAVVEDSARPDAIFYIRKTDGQWTLKKQENRV